MPIASDLRRKSEATYTANGGEEITLAADEQSLFLQTIVSVGADVSKSNPQARECLSRSQTLWRQKLPSAI